MCVLPRSSQWLSFDLVELILTCNPPLSPMYTDSRILFCRIRVLAQNLIRGGLDLAEAPWVAYLIKAYEVLL